MKIHKYKHLHALLAGLGVAALVLVGVFYYVNFTAIDQSFGQVACPNAYSYGTKVPAGYGAAYNVFSSSHERVIDYDCATKKVTVGSGDANQYIYKYAQVLYNGAYMCTWRTNTWKCGCSDSGCTQGKWMLQTAATTTVPAGGLTASTTTTARGMWVWNTSDLLNNTSEANNFATQAQAAGVTDAYLFLREHDYVNQETSLRALLTTLSSKGITAWGLEGSRGYFSDSYGPTNFYDTAIALVNFNKRVPAGGVKFAGFHSDMEPQDGQTDGDVVFPNNFHNGIADTQLSASFLAQRRTLMADWLTILASTSQKVRTNGLKFGIAAPSWVDSYCSEPDYTICAPIQGTHNGQLKPVMEHLMSFTDDYVVMSYNTDPANAANRVAGEAQYASNLPIGSRPRVQAAIETHIIGAPHVSYADTVGKKSRAVALADMTTIKNTLSIYSAFAGVAIHDWLGWKGLPQ